MTTINDEAVRAAIDAAFPGLPAGMTLDEAERRMRAGLAAVVPLIRAQTLREYADRWHYVDHSRWPMSTFGAVPTPYCACGKTWPEGGCTERRNLIADASTFHEPDEPVADVIAAFGSGVKGVTARPLSNREFIDAEVEGLRNAQGWDPSSPEWAVIRAAIAWRRMRLGKPTKPNPESAALIEAVDALGAPPVADGSDVDSAENRVEYGAVHGTCEHWGSWPTAQSLISWLSEHHPGWRPLIRVTSGAGLDQLRPPPVAGSFGAVVHEQTGLKGTSKDGQEREEPADG